MPGLLPGIHVSRPHRKKDVDGRDKPGHDEVYKKRKKTPEETRCE
jgi:hypothetical protein